MSELEQETIENVLAIVPDRPLASLYDIACLYAACDVYDRYTSEYIDWQVSPEALRAMSPGKVEQLTDPEQENSLIAARVDLSGDSPVLGDPAVVIENLTDDLRYKIGFMSRDKTARAIDYSISNSSFNGDDIETLAHDTWGNRFLRGRLERWPFEVPDEVVDKYPLLQRLRTLGEDTNAMEQLEQALLATAEVEETEAIVTVKIKLEPGGDYLYPGEVAALNAAGVRLRIEHLRDGLSVDEAHGPGVGYVTNDSGTVLGGSGGIRGQFGKLQTGRFPNLVSDDAWLARPLKSDQAAAVTSFDDFIGDFSFTRDGVRLHYLPYPTTSVDEELFERFYTSVYRPLREADSSEFVDRLLETYTAEIAPEGTESASSPLEGLVEDDSEYEPFTRRESWLRLYSLMYVGSTDPSRVFVDEPNTSLEAITTLENAYVEVLQNVGSWNTFGSLIPTLEEYIPMEGGVTYGLLFGSFFDSVTASSPDPDDTEREDEYATTNDGRFTRYANLLRGTPITVPDLISEFAIRATEHLQERVNEGRESPFPTRLLLAQYIQLRALDQAGMLGGDSIITGGVCNKNMRSMGDSEVYSSREERLQDFLDNHPMLDDAETRSVFLLGALVGRLSAYQYSENISQKLTEQYPPSSITRRAIPEITQEVLDRTYTYGDKDDISRFNRRYTDRLADSMLVSSPGEWDISEAVAKWLYALGVAYGKQDTSEGIERPEDDEAESDGEVADVGESAEEGPGITDYT